MVLELVSGSMRTVGTVTADTENTRRTSIALDKTVGTRFATRHVSCNTLLDMSGWTR